jgi:hypothetical protein
MREADGAIVHTVQADLRKGAQYWFNDSRVLIAAAAERCLSKALNAGCDVSPIATCPAASWTLTTMCWRKVLHLVAAVLDLHARQALPRRIAQRHNEGVHPVVVHAAAAVGRRHPQPRKHRGRLAVLRSIPDPPLCRQQTQVNSPQVPSGHHEAQGTN